MIKKFKELFSCFPSIKWNQTYPIITSQNITLHYITRIYIYTCIVFDYWQDWDIPSYALKMKSQGFNRPSAESFSQRLHSKSFQIKEFAFSIRSTFSLRKAVLELVPPTLLTMCRRFLDIQSICLIKSNLLLIS